MKTFLISDTHFTHHNIIGFCQRPFDNVRDMDAALIERWNAKVTDDDMVIHVGDAFWNWETAQEIAPQLRGRKFIIRGNHDWGQARLRALNFEPLTINKGDIHYEYLDAGARLVLAHRPSDLPTWYPMGKAPPPKRMKNGLVALSHMAGPADVVICGHEHNNAPIFIKWVRDRGDKARPVMALNLSCEYWEYQPTPVEEVIEIYNTMLGRHLV